MKTPIAILCSGGVDSAVLAVELAERHAPVHPIYLRHGLRWEDIELAHLQRFLMAVAHPDIRPVTVLDLPVQDLYGQHWSVSGEGVPDASTEDDAVYLPGRNLLFLAKVSVWCERHGVPAIALAPLLGNPFGDNTPEFYASMQQAMQLALGVRIGVMTPYAAYPKAEVIRRGMHLPLHLTFSCMDPQDGAHCGACNKCAERRKAFAASGYRDLTVYAASF